MTGTKNDRDMTGVLYGGVWEIWGRKHIFTTTLNSSKIYNRRIELKFAR